MQFSLTPFKRKVLAYITDGDRLLVFRQPEYPEVGIQIPGGTIEEAEEIEGAVLREVLEETGLETVRIHSYLGSFWAITHDRSREFHCFHLSLTQPTPETWRHYEQFSGWRNHPIAFDFFWLPLDSPALQLSRGQEMLPLLRNSAPEAFPQAITIGS